MVHLIIVLFQFYSRVVNRRNFGLYPNPAGGLAHHFREFVDTINLVQLVEHPILSRTWRVLKRNRETLDRVDYGNEPSSLSSLPVRSEGVSDNSLSTESVDHRSEHLVEIESS